MYLLILNFLSCQKYTELYNYYDNESVGIKEFWNIYCSVVMSKGDAKCSWTLSASIPAYVMVDSKSTRLKN